MYRGTKHYWTSPKCGCTICGYVFGKIENPDIDYVFYQGRNPFYRVASLYFEKFIDIHGKMWVNRGFSSLLDFLPQERVKEVVRRDIKKQFNFKSSSIIDVNFNKFVMDILTEDLVNSGDPHILYQTYNEPDLKFNDIILTEDLPYAYDIPRKKLNLGEIDYELLKKDVGVTTKFRHISPKNESLNKLDAGEVSVREWWNYGKVPSSYDSLYRNKEVEDRVRKLYRKDFDFFEKYGINFDINYE